MCSYICSSYYLPKLYDSRQHTSLQYVLFKAFKRTIYMFEQVNCIIKIAQCVQLRLSHPSLLAHTDSHGRRKTLDGMTGLSEFCSCINLILT